MTTALPIKRDYTESTKIIRLFSSNKEQTSKKPNNKKKGKKSEVYPFKTVEDIKKMLDCYIENEEWLHYLYFVLGLNLARRVNDMLSLRWFNFFNPANGEFRDDILEIAEDKTDKLANPRINSACKAAIKLYIEKTGCNPALENYSLPVFLQLSGNYKGRVMSDDGVLRALKKYAAKVGISYNVGTHSLRKTFGAMTRMLHPYDYDSMELLRTIYNHSDTKTTGRYIGLTKQKVDSYYDDMGNFFDNYVTGNQEFEQGSIAPIISLESNDLRDVIKAAYEAGQKNANTNESSVHIDAINEIITLAEELKK